jgi:hypothetical protein
MFDKGVKRMNSYKHCIVHICHHQVSPSLRLLFDSSDPASLRCYTVLEGNANGRIFTDHPLEPTIALARKLGYQTEREFRFMSWIKKADLQAAAGNNAEELIILGMKEKANG